MEYQIFSEFLIHVFLDKWAEEALTKEGYGVPSIFGHGDARYYDTALYILILVANR